MSETNTEIKQVSEDEIYKEAQRRMSDLEGIFSKYLPEHIVKKLGVSRYFKNHPGASKELEDSIRIITEQIFSEAAISLGGLATLQLTEPTRYQWESLKLINTACEKVKRELAQKEPWKYGAKNDLDYDVEEDIKSTKEESEAMLSGIYKTEVILWKLMDEDRWEEARPVLKTLELERENKDLPLKAELCNWKQRVAIHLGDTDLFFESLQMLIQNSETHELRFYYPNPEYVLTPFILKEVVAYAMILSPMGDQTALTMGSNFHQKQGDLFQEHLAKKMAEEIFEKGTIRTAEQFRNFLKEKENEIVQIYCSLNFYVRHIKFVRPEDLPPDFKR